MTASDTFLPPLRDEEIERYARQIIVPGIGAAGQARLCASRVTAVGNPEGVESALTYLASAGLHVLRAPGCAPVDCVVVADVEPGLVAAVSSVSPTAWAAWYVLDESTIRGGVTTVARLRPVLEAERAHGTQRRGASPLAHRIAGLDAACGVVAALLGWRLAGERYEVRLSAVEA